MSAESEVAETAGTASSAVGAEGFDINQGLGQVQELILTHGVALLTNIIAAAAIFIIGRQIAKWVSSLIRKAMGRANIDPTLTAFAGNIINVALLALVVVASLERLGVETTSFAAILAAAGLAIGLALQGSLSNFAAGVIVIIFKPFSLDDYVEAGGTSGTVKDIGIFTTTLTTPDNKVVIVPNAQVTSGNIINYSKLETRRVDFVFGIGYNDDIDQAKAIIAEVIDADARVLKDQDVTIAVSELADSSVNIVARPWVNTPDYWAVLFDVTEAVKKRFDAQGVSIPFPQRDVHVYNHDADAAIKTV